MARLSQGVISTMINKILNDLYNDSEQKLTKRREEIAQRNRTYVMTPLQKTINLLPDNLLNKEQMYELFINYKKDAESRKDKLIEVWSFTSKDKNAINPPVKYRYGRHSIDSEKGNLVPKLQKEAKILCDDIIALRNEKDELGSYLRTTTEHYKGSKQLRKIWPKSLHKYLPAESTVPRAARKLSNKTKVKTKEGLEISSPTFIKKRLTTNLLEKD